MENDVNSRQQMSALEQVGSGSNALSGFLLGVTLGSIYGSISLLVALENEKPRDVIRQSWSAQIGSENNGSPFREAKVKVADRAYVVGRTAGQLLIAGGLAYCAFS